MISKCSSKRTQAEFKLTILQVGDLKEAFNFGTFENGKAQQPIPDSVAPYESQYSDFCTSGVFYPDSLSPLLNNTLTQHR